MVFSSQVFLFYFLPVALLIYYSAPRALRLPVLTVVSLFFYAWLRPSYVLLLLWSTCVDFVSGNFIYGRWQLIGPVTIQPDGTPRASNPQRNLFLLISLCSNLGILTFFKYSGLLASSFNQLLTITGHSKLPVWSILLPAGISFYTFESVSYILDIYYGRARPAAVGFSRPNAGRGSAIKAELLGFNAFACYITQFPHLVAGPIIRYQDLEDQLHNRAHRWDKFARGAFFFSLGLAKKVLIANPLSGAADFTFRPGQALHCIDAWFGLISYSFQIYFDFSGYTDMAIGLGLMFGFEFAKNFDSPYKAQSITDFWRRWHISLSTWLRDYLYIPLGGNRKGESRTYFNLITVMLLGGLWHGAAWKYMIWGGIHGVWLAVERSLGKRSFYTNAPRALRTLFTFLIVNLAWVFFRAENLAGARFYLAGLFALPKHTSVSPLVKTILFAPERVLTGLLAAGLAFFGVQTWDLSKRVTPLRAVFAMALFALAIASLATQANNPFLYFQF